MRRGNIVCISIIIVCIFAVGTMFSLSSRKPNTTGTKPTKKVETKKEATSEKNIKVIIWYADSNNSDVSEEVEVSDDGADTIFSEFAQRTQHVKNAGFNSFETGNDSEGIKSGYLDVDSDFISADNSRENEIALLETLAYTFTDNFDIERLYLTVDGNPYKGNYFALESGDFLAAEMDLLDFEITAGDPGEDEDYYDNSEGDPGEGDPGYNGDEYYDDSYDDDSYDDEYYDDGYYDDGYSDEDYYY